MKKIQFMEWVMLIGTGVPAAAITWVAITSNRYDLEERILVAALSIGLFLAVIVGMYVGAPNQQKKGEG